MAKLATDCRPRGKLVSIMQCVAYLVNRYPEATLTAIRREIHGVERAGVSVLRFAHRPSQQPLLSSVDRTESEATEYLALAGFRRLALAVLMNAVTNSRATVRAGLTAFSVDNSPFRALGHFALACLLHRRLKQSQVRLLHVHFGMTSAVVALLTRELGGPPWCVTIHGPEDFAPENRTRLVQIAGSASKLIAISQAAASAVQSAVLPSPVAPRVVGMGIASSFLAAPLPIERDGAIVCVARLDERKGHKILLEALSKLDVKFRDVRVQFIGDGPLRSEIELELKRLGLEKMVTLRGWLGERAVKEAIDQSRFLVLPSVDEGLPVSIMEAFSRARPVVATSVAGVPELVASHSNGMLVQPNDSNDLAAALTEMLCMSPDVLFALGMNGRKLVEERHDADRNAHSLVSIWREVLAANEA